MHSPHFITTLFNCTIADHHHPHLWPWAPPTSSVRRHLRHYPDMSKCINLDATRSALVASPPILTMSHDHLRPCTTGRHVHAPTPPHGLLPNQYKFYVCLLLPYTLYFSAVYFLFLLYFCLSYCFCSLLPHNLIVKLNWI